MKRLYFTAIVLLIAGISKAQYFQNFNQLTDTGTGAYSNLPFGWAIFEVGDGLAADGKYSTGTGSINTGNVYSFGIGQGDSDRALGTLSSGSNFPTIGAIFINQTAIPLTSVTISYAGEQWRYGGRTTGTRDTLRFEYSLDATGIVGDTGTWTRVNNLDFLSVIYDPADSSSMALDGNAAANRQAITYTITGVSLQPGQSIVIRWSDLNIAGLDDGLAVDDFSISAGLEPGNITSGGAPLPVELTEFKGSLSNGKVLLQWKTASEVNASHFVVEGSGTAGTFQAKGKLTATGAGAYSFTDNVPSEGINFYRLKQVDVDGKVVYSKVITLRRGIGNLFSFAPNPSMGKVRINANNAAGSKVMLQVMDATGKVVFNKTFAGGAPIDLDLSALANGTYFVRANAETGKLIISK